jgi:stress response protein SCP2
MTQDLDALAVMLREASQRRRMKNALAFFNALRKRQRDSNTSLDDMSSNEAAGNPVKLEVDQSTSRIHPYK